MRTAYVWVLISSDPSEEIQVLDGFSRMIPEPI